MKRYRLLVALPVLGLLVGCGGMETDQADQSLKDGDRTTFANDARPFKAALDCELLINPDPAFVATRCPANPAVPPADWVSTVVCKGDASHLGEAQFVGEHCARGFMYDGGKGVFTAANGDQVFSDYFGYTIGADFDEYGRPVMLYMQEVMTITGGDGRFDGATGSALNAVNVSIDHSGPFPLLSVQTTIDGVLGY